MSQYTVEFLERQPRWKPHEEVEDMAGRSSAQRDFRGGGQLSGQPPQEFILAIDKAGNLIQAVVRPNPVNPYDPRKRNRGADMTSFKADTIRRLVYDKDMVIVDIENVPDRALVDASGRRRSPTQEERRSHWEAICDEGNRRLAAHNAKDKAAADAKKSAPEKWAEIAMSANAQTKEALALVTKKERKAKADE